MHLHVRSIQGPILEISSHYSIRFVIISIVFACVLSFIALKMNSRANNDSFFNKYFWYILASLAMGYGIWAMHYIGMMAFSLPLTVTYNILLTALSIIPAMLASFFAFYLVSKPNLTRGRMIISSIFMGLGVCSMHFLGMFSMNLEATHKYSILGLVVTIFASPIAFYVFGRFYKHSQKLYVQIIMGIVIGCSVAVTHYVAMLSMTFYVTEGTVVSDVTIPFEGRSMIIGQLVFGMLVLLAFLIVTVVADKYVEFRAKNYDPHTHLPNYTVFEKKLENKQFTQIAVWQFKEWHVLTNTYGYLFTEELMKKLLDMFNEYKGFYVEIYRIAPNQVVFTSTDQRGNLKLQMDELSNKLQSPVLVQHESLILAAICAFVKVDADVEREKLYEKALAILNMPTIEYDRSVVTYDVNLHSSAFDEEITNDILGAMKNNELFLLYQPKVMLLTNEVIGFEALLRWNHPRFGLLSPAVFIPILEQKDRMILVTDWIIDHVGKQIKAWKYDDVKVKQVAINIPGNYVTSPNLLITLDRMVEKYNIHPDQIELEITETSFVKNLTEAVRAVMNLRNRGYSVALDDFGTGLSSLSYLKRMHISTLKIDKSFIDDVPASVKDASILQAIIGLGKSLNLNVVIEGVEKVEQVDFIQSIYKEAIIQGYYYSKPITPTEVLERYCATKSYLEV